MLGKWKLFALVVSVALLNIFFYESFIERLYCALFIFALNC